jgi:hypothetical protein
MLYRQAGGVMVLLEIKVDLTRTANFLERIALALERISPPPRLPGESRPARFLNIDPAAIAEAEEEADRKREAGTETEIAS